MAKRFFRTTATAIPALVILLMTTTLAFAAGDYHHDAATLLKDFLYRVLNFAVLIAILAFFITRPLKKALAGRRETLAKELEEAQKARDTAEAKFAEYDRKLQDATAEIEQLQAEIRREGELERDKILANARNMAEKMAQDAENAAAQEVAKARRQLRQEAAALAISLARDLLKKNFNEADQKRLVDEYMEKMQKVGELS
ncbi:F-type H+-transporting ATPase subunit b [Geoalkalibacter ferrihydriticus]|uniref:ATP synthase subunit b n=2 Tax=Geoalkalibacter ferrihydriticus TaxID=392333 RepID=A0A0C2DWK3_9BACT|nr:ATP synthase F0 subunit B [Geoalkalibacter ferrihydriticus]KIH77839.1 ATPase [Geoalkalibacter ferrihydriticus DSM 17813]SDL81853.1 F-type H+-transporting ATPase subunit b [Geoalkalibacter ferrihydriticus]